MPEFSEIEGARQEAVGAMLDALGRLKDANEAAYRKMIEDVLLYMRTPGIDDVRMRVADPSGYELYSRLRSEALESLGPMPAGWCRGELELGQAVPEDPTLADAAPYMSLEEKDCLEAMTEDFEARRAVLLEADVLYEEAAAEVRECLESEPDARRAIGAFTGGLNGVIEQVAQVQAEDVLAGGDGSGIAERLIADLAEEWRHGRTPEGAADQVARLLTHRAHGPRGCGGKSDACGGARARSMEPVDSRG